MCLGGPGVGVGGAGLPGSDVGGNLASGFGGYTGGQPFGGADVSEGAGLVGGSGFGTPIGPSGLAAGSASGIMGGAYGGYPNVVADIANADPSNSLGGLPGMTASLSADMGGNLPSGNNISGGNPITNFLSNYVLPIANLLSSALLPMSIPAKAGLSGLFSAGQSALQGQPFSDVVLSGAKGAMSSLPFAGSIISATEGKGPIPALAGLLGETQGGGYAGQPTGSISGMGGGPGADMTMPMLTTGMGYAPIAGAAPSTMPQTFQQTEPQKESISQQQPNIPIENVTASMYSIPTPKINYRNVMASRGVRGTGAKTALPEWFSKGKRGY